MQCMFSSNDDQTGISLMKPFVFLKLGSALTPGLGSLHALVFPLRSTHTAYSWLTMKAFPHSPLQTIIVYSSAGKVAVWLSVFLLDN